MRFLDFGRKIFATHTGTRKAPRPLPRGTLFFSTLPYPHEERTRDEATCFLKLGGYGSGLRTDEVTNRAGEVSLLLSVFQARSMVYDTFYLGTLISKGLGMRTNSSEAATVSVVSDAGWFCGLHSYWYFSTLE